VDFAERLFSIQPVPKAHPKILKSPAQVWKRGAPQNLISIIARFCATRGTIRCPEEFGWQRPVSKCKEAGEIRFIRQPARRQRYGLLRLSAGSVWANK
jgi:hypothetical protein